MSGIFELLGNELVNKAGESLKPSSIRGEGKVIAVYFSAHWCPPCKGFTPKLVEFYNNVKGGSNANKFEVVFASSDNSQEEFDGYFGEMPWWALPFERREDKDKLSKKFGVGGIPTLIFFDGATGKILNKNGRGMVDSDPKGNNFPWRAKTLHDILKEGEYINNINETKSFEEDIKGKVLGIYFSAHWCPPCKVYTPVLSSLYKVVNSETKKFEVIFVSSDQNEKEFKEYHSEMPFLALQYEPDTHTVKDELSEHFEVDGIPTLVIVDEDGRVINKNGRETLSDDEAAKMFPWNPEPVEDLDENSGSHLNEGTCLVYFPGDDEESSMQMKDILKPLGEASQCQAKEEETCQDIYYMIGSSKSDITKSLCKYIKTNPEVKGLYIFDIPNLKMYKAEQEEYTKEAVERFVKDYKDDQLVAQNIGE